MEDFLKVFTWIVLVTSSPPGITMPILRCGNQSVGRLSTLPKIRHLETAEEDLISPLGLHIHIHTDTNAYKKLVS